MSYEKETEKEKRVKSALFSLMGVAKGYLNVCFERGSSVRNTAFLNDNGVVDLHLSPIFQPKDLDEWVNAIVTAEELVQKAQDELLHETNSPNFYKSVLAEIKLRNRKK